MVATPETRYVKSGDVHIAYQVIGDGPLDIVFVPGFVSNLEANWDSPARAKFFHRLASFCRLILFDKRGTGLSDRTSQIFTLEQRMSDVQAIMDEVGSKRAALFGVSEGGADVDSFRRYLPATYGRARHLWFLRQTVLGPGLPVRLDRRQV